MIKAMAMLSIISLLTLAQLGNFWFTYGIWPRSWGAFILFYILSLFLSQIMTIILKEVNE